MAVALRTLRDRGSQLHSCRVGSKTPLVHETTIQMHDRQFGLQVELEEGGQKHRKAAFPMLGNAEVSCMVPRIDFRR